MPDRVLIVGFDGGTWTAFRPLVERGLMPNLERLMGRGCHGVLESTLPPITPPAWTTLLTGLLPDRHGIFGFFENMIAGDAKPPDGGPMRPVSSRSVRCPTLFSLLGDADKPVMSINLPMSYPPTAVHGIMITGFFTPEDADDFTHPPELARELDDYVIDLCNGGDMVGRVAREQQYDDVSTVTTCAEIVRRRCRHVLTLGRAHPWTFGIVVFTGTDRIFHRLWPEVAALVTKDAFETELDRALAAFFRELDEALGAVVDAFADAHVMVVSDHGFGGRFDRTVYPNLWLERHGFLQRRHGRSGSSPVRSLMKQLRRLTRKVMTALLPRSLVSRLLLKRAARHERAFEALDLDNTVAHFVDFDGGATGGVRLVGAAVEGMSESERSALIARLVACLKEMKDPDTGEPLTDRVGTRDQFFGPPAFTFLPEIIIRFRDDCTGRTDPLESQLVTGPPDTTPGLHRPDGMFVLAGEHVKALGETRALHLVDVAPTVLHLCGEAVPGYMQGNVPEDMFDASWLAGHPVRRSDVSLNDTRGGSEEVYSAEQEEQVKDRLRQLGYME